MRQLTTICFIYVGISLPPGTTASIKQNTRTMSRAAIKVARPLMPNSHSLFSFTFFIRLGTSYTFSSNLYPMKPVGLMSSTRIMMTKPMASL